MIDLNVSVEFTNTERFKSFPNRNRVSLMIFAYFPPANHFLFDIDIKSKLIVTYTHHGSIFRVENDSGVLS